MKVIITGGGGFLGSQLCQKLLERGALTGPSGFAEKIGEIVLLDAVFHRPATDARVKQITGDISNRDTVFSAIGSDAAIAIFHLASMVSGECEDRFDDALLPAKTAIRASLGGSKLVRLTDGRLLAAGRALGREAKDGRTTLFWVDVEHGTLRRFAAIDGTSYAGVVEHEGMLWISCGNTDASGIFLAKMKVPAAQASAQSGK